MNGDTLDKIDEAIKKYSNREDSTEIIVKNDTDTKIFNGLDSSSDLEKTMEFNGVVDSKLEEVSSNLVKKKNNDTFIIIAYAIALIITVLLVTAFILFLY